MCVCLHIHRLFLPKKKGTFVLGMKDPWLGTLSHLAAPQRKIHCVGWECEGKLSRNVQNAMREVLVT